MPKWLDRWAEKRMAKGRAILAEHADAPAVPSLRELAGHVREGLTDAIGEMFDDRAGVIAPPPWADFKRPPPETTEAQRPAVAAAEREARDAARAPYRTGPAPVFTRIPTRGEDQLDALTACLATLDPARVYGAYRVPHRYDERRTDEKRAYLEWEVAHAPDAAGAGPVELAGFDRADAWVRRAAGEPRVLDEDVGGALVARARLAPEDCFALTRLWQVRVDSIGDTWSPRAVVSGSLLAARPGARAAQRALAEEAPLDVGPPAFHVTVLDWEAVAAWNAPKRWRAARVPAPLPHLPTSPQELLTAYLEVVGVAPGDCYGAQVTRTSDGGLGDLGMGGVSRAWNDARFPCADGRARARLDAAEHVVVAYRDRPEYADGRRRWGAYEDEVLHARLSHLTDSRPPLEDTWSEPDPLLLELLGLFNPLDPFPVFPRLRGRHDRPQLGPYVA